MSFLKYYFGKYLDVSVQDAELLVIQFQFAFFRYASIDRVPPMHYTLPQVSCYLKNVADP